MKTEKLVLGILAHVDAGKTTLAESMLYTSGNLKKMGRVDHKDAFLDTYELEKTRGITIFSKQAQMKLEKTQITLLDTPGHVDFSAEMERSLQVLDYAILVISAADGVSGHVQTLWGLLKRYRIPTFLFVNKMDQEGTDREALMGEIKKHLDDSCVDFSNKMTENAFFEEVAVCEEKLLEDFLETGHISKGKISEAILKRKLFPCFFGSALKQQGIHEFLNGIEEYSQCPDYPEAFGARIYKIGRDRQGARLTYMKITGGTLAVKTVLKSQETDSESSWEEKADQIRIYSGNQFQSVSEAEAGSICAVTGLTRTRSGETLGIEHKSIVPLLEPVLTYQILLPESCNVHEMFRKLSILEEEEPQLHVIWEERTGEIHVQVMGAIQIEILKSLIQERFQTAVEFGNGSIIYKETIANTVEGVGHFEPLRHYAEVHLKLEPGEPGSGMQFESSCSEDLLDRNWQRLVLTHLEECQHHGVLTGSEITDMKITLVAGRAHQKHTEGGDFRQATYRAVRQGLMQAESVLLEPVYEFCLKVPSENVGRALSDIQKMEGKFSAPELENGFSVIRGSVPVSRMRDYQLEVAAYTKGRGSLFCSLKGYEPCHNSEEIISKIGYEPELDLDHPSGSVFCAHGAGFVVPWQEVFNYMHLEPVLTRKKIANEDFLHVPRTENRPSQRELAGIDQELEEIFQRTYGTGKRVQPGWHRPVTVSADSTHSHATERKTIKEEYLLVDGYNIIFAWEELKELSKTNLEAARGRLMDILSDYQGSRSGHLILVFDAYKVEGNPGESFSYHNIFVVYTKEAETADQYIEKAVHKNASEYQVTVATSDGLEQVIILGQGAIRMSAKELKEAICCEKKAIHEEHLSRESRSGSYLFQSVSEETAEQIEQIRLGKKKQE